MNERLSAMRCLFCNAEMVLMEAVQADPTTLPNFEHRTFLCPACHGVERRLAYAGARAPSAASHSASPATNLNIGSGMPQSAWSRAVEKVLHKQIELNGRAAAKRRPRSPSTVETLGSGRRGGAEERPRPSTKKSIDLVSELNRIWDDPRPTTNKSLEPPTTPEAE
jgi:hypothetical protein